jgi:hypothetical protein
MRLVMIGGSDAGISAALRARELSSDVEATVVVADDNPNFSIWGLPFYVSGETPGWHRLVHRTLEELEQTGIHLTGDRKSGQLLGAQILGYWQCEVAKRIDVFATARFADLSVDGINLSYIPPLGSPRDAVQLVAQASTAARNGGMS